MADIACGIVRETVSPVVHLNMAQVAGMVDVDYGCCARRRIKMAGDAVGVLDHRVWNQRGLAGLVWN